MADRGRGTVSDELWTAEQVVHYFKVTERTIRDWRDRDASFPLHRPVVTFLDPRIEVYAPTDSSTYYGVVGYAARGKRVVNTRAAARRCATPRRRRQRSRGRCDERQRRRGATPRRSGR